MTYTIPQDESYNDLASTTGCIYIFTALAVDPRRSWKPPWRWYVENMLNCCVDLEQVKKTGITFSTFACLARCQGLNVNAVHGSESTVDEFRRVVKEICSEEEEEVSFEEEIETTTTANEQQQRPTSFLIVSYTRQVIGQTGSGHFSPIGAYDEASDHVLVLDTARFKYGPHWVPLPLLFDALLPIDPDTGKSRGYMVVSIVDDGGHRKNDAPLSHLPLSVLFGSKKSKDFIRREYKQYLKHHNDCDSSGGNVEDVITLDLVVSFWTKDYTNNNHVWELVEPQLQPVDSSDISMVNHLRQLVQNLIRTNEHASSIPQELLSKSLNTNACSTGECCNHSTHNMSGRVLEISPAEVLYIVYLASLPLDVRRDIVFRKKYDVEQEEEDASDDTIREQLLAEAALIAYTIETCDADF